MPVHYEATVSPWSLLGCRGCDWAASAEFGVYFGMNGRLKVCDCASLDPGWGLVTPEPRVGGLDWVAGWTGWLVGRVFGTCFAAGDLQYRKSTGCNSALYSADRSEVYATQLQQCTLRLYRYCTGHCRLSRMRTTSTTNTTNTVREWRWRVTDCTSTAVQATDSKERRPARERRWERDGPFNSRGNLLSFMRLSIWRYACRTRRCSSVHVLYS